MLTSQIENTSGMLINPRCACAARVTVVGSVCLCVSVCPLNISPLECLFVLKTISCTQRATKVKTIVWISRKLLHCRDALHGYNT